MANGIPPGPDRADLPQLPSQPHEAQTGMTRMYTARKAPGFAQMLEHWFHGAVTSQMVTGFEQGVMKMISASIKQSKSQHKKIEEKIKKRIKEG